MSKKTSVFLDRDLSHAEAQRRGENVGRKERIDRKAWTHVRLGDYATLLAGGTPSRSVSDYYGGSIPWCSISDISGAGKFLIRTAESLTRLGIENSSAKLIPADAILFAMYASIGECALATTPLATSQAILGIYNLKEFDREYLYYYLCSQKEVFINQGQTGTQSNLSKEIVSNIQVPKPDIKEQRRIANSLSSIDANIATVQSLFSKYKAIKKATVNLLLKQNQGWRNVKLGDVLKVCHGKCQHLIESEAGLFPILATSGEIGRANQFLYDKPSVLIGRKGTIDKPQYIETPFWTIDTLFYTKIADGYIPKFVFYLCQTIDWASLNEASGVPSLSANRIESIEVCVPQNMHEQKRIVAALDSIDNTIKGLKTQLEKSQAIKHGMMSYFFG